MFHQRRKHVCVEFDSCEQLARQLFDYINTPCTAYQLGRFYFLNDSTSADGAQEYAVFFGAKQIESYTVGWMSYEKILEALRELTENPLEETSETQGVPESIDNHKVCSLCK